MRAAEPGLVDLGYLVHQDRTIVQIGRGAALLLDIADHPGKLFCGQACGRRDLIGGHLVIDAVQAQIHPVVGQAEVELFL